MINTEIRLIVFIVADDGEAVYSQQKQDLKLTVAQIGEGNGNPLQYSCLENPMEGPGGLQSMASLRVRHD